MKKLLGVSWKTTLAGYLVAAVIAIQPLLLEDIDFDSRKQVLRYSFRLLAAALVALWGKYSADSRQVKDVDAKLDNHIDSVS